MAPVEVDRFGPLIDDYVNKAEDIPKTIPGMDGGDDLVIPDKGYALLVKSSAAQKEADSHLLHDLLTDPNFIEDMQSQFAEMDLDGSGKASSEEVCKMLEQEFNSVPEGDDAEGEEAYQIPPEVQDQFIHEAFANMDLNGDDEVDEDEFVFSQALMVAMMTGPIVEPFYCISIETNDKGVDEVKVLDMAELAEAQGVDEVPAVEAKAKQMEATTGPVPKEGPSKAATRAATVDHKKGGGKCGACVIA